jgi:nicotinamide-nucleotide amidase
MSSHIQPPGTVWIAVCGKLKTSAQKFSLRFDRKRNIENSAILALNMLRKLILEEKE